MRGADSKQLELITSVLMSNPHLFIYLEEEMKCIRRTYSPFSIVRVSNKAAAQEVQNGMAVYISKSEWKKIRDKNNDNMARRP